MEGAVAVFHSRAAAEDAFRAVRPKVSADSLILLTPESSPRNISEVPTTDAERAGIGQAITGVVGAAIGSAAGLGIGSAVASLVVPGVGAILAVGVGAAAALGLTGAAVGANLGKKEEAFLDTGVPRDDVGCYRELLRQGRSLLIAQADTPQQLEELSLLMQRHGGEPYPQVRHRLQSPCEGAA